MEKETKCEGCNGSTNPSIVCKECADKANEFVELDRQERFKKQSSYRKLREQNEALKNEIGRLMYDISVLIDDEAPMEQKFAVRTVHTQGVKGVSTTAAGIEFVVPGTKYNLVQHIDLKATQIEDENEFTAHCIFDSKQEYEYVTSKKEFWLAGRNYICDQATFEVHLGTGKILSAMHLTKVADSTENDNQG
jgi:hypothetical protein